MTSSCSEVLNQTTRETVKNLTLTHSRGCGGAAPGFSQSMEIQLVVIIVLNTVSAIVGSIGNSMVFLAISLNKRLHTASNFFIASLSCADLLVCFAAQPQYIAFLAGYRNGLFSQVRRVFAWISTVTSVNNMFAVTVDRCVAVSSPYLYQTQMTRKVWLPAIAMIWIISFTLGVLSGIKQTARRVSLYYCVIVMAVMVVMYGYLFTVAQSQARKMIKRCGSKHGYITRILTRENKALRTVSIVCGCFLVCWLPLLLHVFIEFAVNQGNGSSGGTLIMLSWFNSLALCNSCINPFIYCLRVNEYKTAVKNLLFHRAKRLPVERIGRWSHASESASAFAATLADMRNRLKAKRNSGESA